MKTIVKKSRSLVLAVLVALLPGGCSGVASIGDVFSEPPAWESYANSLEEVGLAESALGREWLAAAERALSQAPSVETPYREAGYLAPEEPRSLGYRLYLRRGHRLVVDVEMQSAEPGRIFLDLFRLPPEADSLAEPERVAASAADSTRLDVEIREDGDYVLRMQPELLRGGRYEITVRRNPTLAFPVEGAGNRDIGSGWGDSRDAGSRSHEGVDIFAPRGTPVLAVEDGRVRRVGTNRLGGNTIWVTGGEGRSFYYAHLDRQSARSGDRVRTGDTLGWVGNTGNAAPTPPHLHFGVRVRGGPGWVDPYPYIARTDAEPAPVAVETSRLGERIRMRGEVNLRSGPGVDSDAQRSLPRHTVVRAVAGTVDWYRVELPDRSTGYVWSPLIDGLEPAVSRFRAPESRLVRDAPAVLAAPLDSIGPDAEVPVLGRFGDWTLVRAGEHEGWVFEGDPVAGG